VSGLRSRRHERRIERSVSALDDESNAWWWRSIETMTGRTTSAIGRKPWSQLVDALTWHVAAPAPRDDPEISVRHIPE
jgi:hypothetical protein